MSIATKLKEARDKVLEILNRPIDVLTDTTREKRRYEAGKFPTDDSGFTPTGTPGVKFGGGGSGPGPSRPGSRGPTPAQLEAQRLERLRQAELLRKQQEEAKRLREQLESERKSKIESGKISGQVSGGFSKQGYGREGVVSVSDPHAEYRTSDYGRKVAEFSKQSFAEAQAKGRNLSIGERQTLAGSIFGGGVVEDSAEVYKGSIKTTEPDRTGQTFIRNIGGGAGLFSKTSKTGTKGTLEFSPPTPGETEKMKQQEIKSSALLSSVPLISQVKFFNYQLTSKQEQDIYGGSTISTIGKFLDPRYSYKLAKEQEQLRQDILEQKKIQKKVKGAEINLLDSGILKEELESGKITSKLTPSQESSLKKYNVIVGYALEKPSTKRLSQERRTAFNILATSESKYTKIGGAALIKSGQTLPYFTPIGRALLGTDLAFEGAKSYDVAETKGQKLLATGQVALGGALAYSGVKGVIGGTTGATATSITGSATKIKLVKYASYGLGTGLGVGVGALDYYSTLKQTGSKEVALGAAIGSGGTILGGTYGPKLKEISLFGKKPEKIIPTKELQQQVQPFTRQRATVLLKTEKGKYILGKTKSGEIISIGGGIEKGQTPRTAALAELKQETGLNIKDIIGFKKAGKVVYPEETFYLYTGVLKKGSKITPASDIKSIVELSPKNLFIKGATGQTSLQPVSRYVPLKGKVRSYESGIINYLETGKQPTWLKISTQKGDFFLGTQSRYNVPYASQKKYLGEEELLLTHGTQQPSILKRYSIGEKTFEVEASATKRGQAQGLYVQPPVSITDYPKVIKLEGYKGTGTILSKKEISSLPTKLIKKPSPGYVGLSYLGFEGGTSSEIIIKSNVPTRAGFIFKESPSKILSTPKTFSGMESEFIIPPKTVIGTGGRAEVFSIGLKRVYIQPTKIITNNLNKLKTIPGISSSSYKSGASYITNPLLTSSYSLGSISKRKPTPYYKSSYKGYSYSSPYKIKPYKQISYAKPIEYKKSYYNKYKPLGYKYKSYEPYKPMFPGYPKKQPPTKSGLLLFKRPQLKMKSKPSQIIKPRPTKYQPSFTASALKITAKKKPLLAPGALSLRPIIIK